MAMIKCKVCGEEISLNAKVCPKCGAKTEKGKKQDKRIIIGVISGVAALIIIVCSIFMVKTVRNVFSNIFNSSSSSSRIENRNFKNGDKLTAKDLRTNFGKIYDSNEKLCASLLSGMDSKTNSFVTTATYNADRNEIFITYISSLKNPGVIISTTYNKNTSEFKSILVSVKDTNYNIENSILNRLSLLDNVLTNTVDVELESSLLEALRDETTAFKDAKNKYGQAKYIARHTKTTLNDGINCIDFYASKK